MANETRRHISELLLSNRKHAKYLGILACLAVVVAFGVSMGLRQNGRAATHEEQVLDCHYAGNGAHTHDANCYDKDGNLVCPLPERELHTHSDACYDTETRLVCGQEEVIAHTHDDSCYDEDGNLVCDKPEVIAHTHDDSCYDEDGNLICGLEEVELHTHTDDCYETTKTLTCGKEEITEEHVHGPGCFKTIVVQDEEEEAEEEQYPEQEFQGILKRRDNKGEERVVLSVSVKAPEGALPADSKMVVSDIAESEADDIEAKVESAVKRTNGDNVQVKQWQAVDIKFYDKDGNEIEPNKDVEVKITSSKVNEIESPVLVHVIDKDKDSAKGKDVDAEVLDKVSIVNQDEDDTSEGNEDTLKFQSGEFSPYVIVELEELYAEYLSSNGSTYNIKVTADGDAQIPTDAKLSVTELQETSRAYLDAYYMVVQNKLIEDPTFDESQFGMAAVDISIVDANGNVFEPYAPVSVSINMKLPADVDKEVLQNTLEVQHLDTSTGETVVQTVADVSDGIEVGKSSATAEFVVDSFSTFTITWTGNSEEPDTVVTDPQAKATLSIQENGTTYATVNVHYVDTQGNNLVSPLSASVNANTPVAIEDALGKAIEGYTFAGAHFGEASGEEITTIAVARETSTSTGSTYTYLKKTDKNGRIGGSTTKPAGYNEFYADDEGKTQIYWNYYAFRKTDTRNGALYSNQSVYGKATGTSTAYSYTMSFDNQAVESLTQTGLAGVWNNAADIYLVYESEDTGVKKATIHFGTLNADGSYTELDKSTSMDITADTISLSKAIAGYEYVGAYYSKSATQRPSANTTSISPTLKKEDDVWYFTDVSSFEKGHLVNNSHIYASYMQKTGTSSTTPQNNSTIPAPSTIKNVTDNHNGTYDIQLDIIGKEIVESERKGANVLLIFDRTYSMGSDMGNTTRFKAAQAAVTTLVDALDPANNPVEIAMFTFDRQAHDPYTKAGGGYWTSDGKAIKTYTNGLTMADSGSTPGAGGTNWEAAFEKAKTVLTTITDNDPTYVIFLTDGNPTFYNGATAINNKANENSNEYTRARTAAFNLDTKYKMYNILCANASDGPLLQTLTNDQTRHNPAYDATHILANDSTTLKNTFQNIADYIVNQLAAANVSTNDGITELSTVNASVSGAAGAFKYYTAYEVTQKNGEYYYYTFDGTDGTRVEHKVSANDVQTYEYQDKDGHPKSYLYYNRTSWKKAPGASYSDDSGVTWDLSSEGALTGGRIYSVRFTIWPSQEAYDLLANLNNGIWEYEAGHENSITDAERNQVYESGGVYYLKTNTTLDTSYEFAGNAYSDNISYHQGAMNLDSEKIALQKLWPENLLDSYEAGRSDTGVKDVITLSVTKDGQRYLDVDLKKDDNWKDDDVYISCGLMTIDENGKVDLKEPGHDYTVIEPQSFSYYWDLIADVYRPMVINGETTLLVLDETAKTADNTNTFKIDGKIYKRQASSDNTLEASNWRRSNLNLTKKVNGINAPSDAYFTFKATVLDKASDKVWFSAFDTAVNQVVMSDGFVIAGAEKEIKDGSFSGYYIADSGAEVTFKIKAGWNVRYLNLLHGSTFKFEEVTLPEGFNLESVGTSTKYELSGWAATDGAVAEGTLIEPNNEYTVTYTNKWDTIDVLLRKVDGSVPGRDIAGAVFNLSYFDNDANSWVQVSGDLNEIKPGYVDAEDPSNNVPNPVSLEGVGVGRYKLKEIKAPNGFVVLNDEIFFEVYKENGEYKVRLNRADGTPLNNATRASVTSNNDGGKLRYTITISNIPGEGLPATGGMGTMPFTILGTAIVVMAILAYGLQSRRSSGRRSM